MSGAKLYLYEANTSTPVQAYQDFGLTTGLEHSHPIVADANGRIPEFWLADGSYRARLTDSAGVVQFDLQNVLALGASSGEGGGGGGEGVAASAIFATGDVLWMPKSGTRTGWVRHNGRTIGSASSGGAERANADVEALFTFLWTNYSDTLCPVGGGRGGSAAADWTANKTIATLDLRGRTPVGLDDMGNASASRLNGVTFTTGNATTAASIGGAALHTLTTDQMPSHGHTATVTDPSHDHFTANDSVDPDVVARVAQFTQPGGAGATFGALAFAGSSGQQLGITRAVTDISVSNSNTGGGSSHNNMPPFSLGTFYVKL